MAQRRAIDQDILSEMLEKALVDFAFLPGFRPLSRYSLDFFYSAHCSIAFRGPTNGTIGIIADTTFSRIINSALFGHETEAPTDIWDAFRELVNVFAGNYLNEALDGRLYSLGLPEMRKVTEKDIEKIALGVSAVVLVHGAPLMVYAYEDKMS